VQEENMRVHEEIANQFWIQLAH